MIREKIPNFRGYSSSFADDDGIGPPEWIKELRVKIGKEWQRRKKEFRAFHRRGILEDQVKRKYVFGPLEMPLDCFTSSRWNERRTQVPLPRTRDDWHLIWKWWKRAGSYKNIKKHIEDYGMRRPIDADWFVNYDPNGKQLYHRCFAFTLRNLQWPFLILSTGNERLMMAMFEWEWETITTLIHVRDCGFDPVISSALNGLAEIVGCRTRGINRSVSDKGTL